MLRFGNIRKLLLMDLCDTLIYIVDNLYFNTCFLYINIVDFLLAFLYCYNNMHNYMCASIYITYDFSIYANRLY